MSASPSAAHAFCHRCGTAYGGGDAWPRSCGSCSNVTYRNPLPVGVAIVPVAGHNGEIVGILGVARGIPPQIGGLALPGGYSEFGEGIEQSAARETGEETHILIDPARFAPVSSACSPRGEMLLFCQSTPVSQQEVALALARFKAEPIAETQEIVVLRPGDKLCFPLHQAAFDAACQRLGIAAPRPRGPRP